MIASSIFGNQEPVRYEILNKDGEAWLDVDRDSKIDDGDAYLTLNTAEHAEYVDFKDLKKVLAGSGPMSSEQLLQVLGEQYGEPDFQATGIVNGSMCFDMISVYRQKQTFEEKDGRLFLTLTPDPDAPFQKYVPPAPEPEPAVDPDALTEATCVERDGILHWLYPGEKLAPGDKVIGNTDNFVDNLTKRQAS